MTDELRWWRTYDTGEVAITTVHVKIGKPVHEQHQDVKSIVHAATSAESVLLTETFSHPDFDPTSGTAACEFWNDGHPYYDIYCARPPVGARWTEL